MATPEPIDIGMIDSDMTVVMVALLSFRKERIAFKSPGAISTPLALEGSTPPLLIIFKYQIFKRWSEMRVFADCMSPRGCLRQIAELGLIKK